VTGTVTRELTGTGVGRGIAVGPVRRMAAPLPDPIDTPSTRTPAEERERAEAAIEATAQDLRDRADRAEGAGKDVLQTAALMAADPSLKTEIEQRIDAGTTAEFAVHDAMAMYRTMLEGLGGYLGERAGDLDDVARRVVARLAGVAAPGIPESGTPFVLVARDLAPADTALLDPAIVQAIVTADGGPTSHTAILAREKDVPAVVGTAGALGLEDGTVVAVDAGAGRVIVDPDDATIAALRADAEGRRRAPVAVGPGRLADGSAVALLANLGSAAEADAAFALGAEGVGLFRTEFLFLDAAQAPSVATQEAEYRRLLDAFPGRKVVVRVLDAGADKPLAFLTEDGEENPALGQRGLRALLRHEEVLHDQLTALANAAAASDARLQVMAPMVATVADAQAFAEVAHAAGLAEAGVMVEIPSAALIADRILGVSDFASIGTNDLTQYTMAADRLLGGLAGYQNPWHPAVLDLVGRVGAAGAAVGKNVGVCGEAAADPLLAVVLVGLGVTSLSMSPSALADVRAELAVWTRESARTAAQAALAADSAEAAQAAVRALAP
jgi:phosphoenolpyruvate-protein phosphotransferase (PTS system enzyme I)